MAGSDVNEAEFEREVIEASYKTPVVVDFWAAWCGPCKQLAPILEQAVADRAGAVKLVKVDTETNQQLAVKFGIQGIPAVKGFRDGQIVGEFTGLIPRAQIEQFLDAITPPVAEVAAEPRDENSFRAALVENPGDLDAALALARILLGRGEATEAIAVLEPVRDASSADGLLAASELLANPLLDPEIVAVLERLTIDPEDALGALIDLLPGAAEARRERIRRVMIGIFAERAVDDPIVITYRKRLASALY